LCYSHLPSLRLRRKQRGGKKGVQEEGNERKGKRRKGKGRKAILSSFVVYTTTKTLSIFSPSLNNQRRAKGRGKKRKVHEKEDQNRERRKKRKGGRGVTVFRL